MFHQSEPIYGVKAIKFFEIHFMDSILHLIHRVMKKCVRFKPMGLNDLTPSRLDD
jgi:hypothetical protein